MRPSYALTPLTLLQYLSLSVSGNGKPKHAIHMTPVRSRRALRNSSHPSKTRLQPRATPGNEAQENCRKAAAAPVAVQTPAAAPATPTPHSARPSDSAAAELQAKPSPVTMKLQQMVAPLARSDGQLGNGKGSGFVNRRLPGRRASSAVPSTPAVMLEESSRRRQSVTADTPSAPRVGRASAATVMLQQLPDSVLKVARPPPTTQRLRQQQKQQKLQQQRTSLPSGRAAGWVQQQRKAVQLGRMHSRSRRVSAPATCTADMLPSSKAAAARPRLSTYAAATNTAVSAAAVAKAATAAFGASVTSASVASDRRVVKVAQWPTQAPATRALPHPASHKQVQGHVPLAKPSSGVEVETGMVRPHPVAGKSTATLRDARGSAFSFVPQTTLVPSSLTQVSETGRRQQQVEPRPRRSLLAAADCGSAAAAVTLAARAGCADSHIAVRPLPSAYLLRGTAPESPPPMSRSASTSTIMTATTVQRDTATTSKQGICVQGKPAPASTARSSTLPSEGSSPSSYASTHSGEELTEECTGSVCTRSSRWGAPLHKSTPSTAPLVPKLPTPLLGSRASSRSDSRDEGTPTTTGAWSPDAALDPVDDCWQPISANVSSCDFERSVASVSPTFGFGSWGDESTGLQDAGVVSLAKNVLRQEGIAAAGGSRSRRTGTRRPRRRLSHQSRRARVPDSTGSAGEHTNNE